MYVGGFDSPDDLLGFVKVLADHLEQLHFDESADELTDWAEGCWTTGSEFVGELGIVCKRIVERDGDRLPERLRSDVDRCLKEYEEVFPKIY